MIKITRTIKERKCNHEEHYGEEFDYNMQMVSFFGFSQCWNDFNITLH